MEERVFDEKVISLQALATFLLYAERQTGRGFKPCAQQLSKACCLRFPWLK